MIVLQCHSERRSLETFPKLNPRHSQNQYAKICIAVLFGRCSWGDSRPRLSGRAKLDCLSSLRHRRCQTNTSKTRQFAADNPLTGTGSEEAIDKNKRLTKFVAPQRFPQPEPLPSLFPYATCVYRCVSDKQPQTNNLR